MRYPLDDFYRATIVTLLCSALSQGCNSDEKPQQSASDGQSSSGSGAGSSGSTDGSGVSASVTEGGPGSNSNSESEAGSNSNSDSNTGPTSSASATESNSDSTVTAGVTEATMTATNTTTEGTAGTTGTDSNSSTDSNSNSNSNSDTNTNTDSNTDTDTGGVLCEADANADACTKCIAEQCNTQYCECAMDASCLCLLGCLQDAVLVTDVLTCAVADGCVLGGNVLGKVQNSLSSVLSCDECGLVCQGLQFI